MKASSSPSSGLCAIATGAAIQILHLPAATVLPSETAHLLCGAVDDWKPLPCNSREEAIQVATRRYECARVVANLELCLAGVSTSLQSDLLEEVEDLLLSTGNAAEIVSALLRAPLIQPDALGRLAAAALSRGLGATGHLLERTSDAQPLLRRFADRWLTIPDDTFAGLQDGRRSAWRLAVESGVVVKTLSVSTAEDVNHAWAELVFRVSQPSDRLRFARIAKAVTSALFPDYSAATAAAHDNSAPEDHEGGSRLRHDSIDAQAQLQRTLKQIDAIIVAVSEGQDARAHTFLHELVATQLTHDSDVEFAVKSLCNIAQQCADMFRTDFELECLTMALSIAPDDAWTLIQLADHLKRVGKFDDAIATLQRASHLGNPSIVSSSLADVYVHMGRYEDALALYASISNAQWDPTIRGAEADILRRWGHLDAAQARYEQIIRDGLATPRVTAGLAEVAKRQGRLVEARELYEALLSGDAGDDRAVVIYRCALANVLVRLGSFAEAYRHLDSAVHLLPFSRQARIFRAAVAGLLGKPGEAIAELPEIGQTRAFNEWVGEYVRGLLLLMLDRYADARRALLIQFESAPGDRDADGIRRLGAAVCLLRTRAGVEDAGLLLTGVPVLQDAFADSIRAALQYHVAIATERQEDARRLEVELSVVSDAGIRSLVAAIESRDWVRATAIEVRTVLRLAA